LSTTTRERPASAARAGFAALIRSPFRILSLLIALAVLVLVLYPILRVLLALFIVDGAPTLAPIIDTITYPKLGKILLDTTLVVGGGSIVALVIGSMLAWLNERTDARMGRLTDVLPIVSFLLPVIAGAIGWQLLLSPDAGFINGALRGLLDLFGIHLTEGPLSAFSWPAVIMIYAFAMVPLVFLTVSAALRSLDSSLEEAARLSGAGLLRTIRTVTIPSILPSIGGALFLTTWYGLALFSIPYVLAKPAGIDILSVEIIRLLKQQYPPNMAVAVGLGSIMVIALGAIWRFQRRALRGGRFAVIGGKGQQVTRIELHGWRLPARIFMILYVIVVVLLPLIALLLVSLNGFWTLNLKPANFSFASVVALFDSAASRNGIMNSVLLAVVCGLIAMLVATLISQTVHRSRGRFAQLIDVAPKIPAAVSSLVLALGFVFAFAGAPFFLGGTLVILALVYIVIALPEASVTTDGAVSRVGNQLTEASHIFGAGAARTFAKVELPLLLPGLAVGMALVFVRIMGDIEIAAVLSGSGNTVVGFQILAAFNNGGYDQLAALGLTIVLISAIFVILILALDRALSSWNHPPRRRFRQRRGARSARAPITERTPS